MSKRVPLLLVAAAGIVAAVAAPAFVAGNADVQAQCRSYFGSRNDGICLDGPGGPDTSGIPWIGIGPTDNGGPGISTGPLFPGQTINTPVA